VLRDLVLKKSYALASIVGTVAGLYIVAVGSLYSHTERIPGLGRVATSYDAPVAVRSLQHKALSLAFFENIFGYGYLVISAAVLFGLLVCWLYERRQRSFTARVIATWLLIWCGLCLVSAFAGFMLGGFGTTFDSVTRTEEFWHTAFGSSLFVPILLNVSGILPAFAIVGMVIQYLFYRPKSV
jgi:hypothetical protein